ncbi:MAG: translation initiation factor IF-3 [Permianibacter sp.]
MSREARTNPQRENRINDEITAREVRLIGEEGQQIGVVPFREALATAEEAGLDLVEISPDAVPPVCKIMDYGKYLYIKSKQQAEAKKKQVQIQVKEIKFRPGTDVGDYQVKLRNILRFFEDGDKAKITVRFRGREMAHQELGMQMMERLQADTAEHAVVEFAPKMEGKMMTMILAPKKKTK